MDWKYGDVGAEPMSGYDGSGLKVWSTTPGLKGDGALAGDVGWLIVCRGSMVALPSLPQIALNSAMADRSASLPLLSFCRLLKSESNDGEFPMSTDIAL